MKIKCYVTNFSQILQRFVEIPDEEIKNLSLSETLSLVFKYGQNDFQPQDCPSLSVGDLIVYDNSVFIIGSMGFTNVVTGEFF